MHAQAGDDSIMGVNPIEKCSNVRRGSRKVSRARARSHPSDPFWTMTLRERRKSGMSRFPIRSPRLPCGGSRPKDMARC